MQAITPHEMQKAKVLMYRSLHGLESNVAGYMRQYDLQPLSTFTSNSNYIMLKKLEQTNCVSLLPKYMWDFYSPLYPNLTSRPIDPMLTCDLILTVPSNERNLTAHNCKVSFRESDYVFTKAL